MARLLGFHFALQVWAPKGQQEEEEEEKKKKKKSKCEHGRQETQCKDCRTGYCAHGRQKHQCKDCGTGYCAHGRLKGQCKDCGTGRYSVQTKRERGRAALSNWTGLTNSDCCAVNKPGAATP
jgi:hypothetical protein